MYDVIVIGAGPAGMSIASEISKDLNILVIDGKEKLGECTKSWFIPGFLIDDNPEVMSFMDKGILRLLCSTASGKETCWDTNIKGGYYYVKEHEILEYWGKKILDNGAKITLGTYYADHTTYKDKVVVDTTDGRYDAKLLIDASGHDSMVKKKYKRKEPNYYWWSVYGAIVKHPNGLNGMKNGDYMLWQTFKDTQSSDDTTLREGRPVFEYEILTENSSFPFST